MANAAQTRTLIGRDAELERVEEFLGAIGSGPAALLLEGEIGIGKTTLFEPGPGLGCRSTGSASCAAARASARRSSPTPRSAICSQMSPRRPWPDLPAPQRRALEVALLRAEPEGEQSLQRAVGLGLLGVLRSPGGRARRRCSRSTTPSGSTTRPRARSRSSRGAFRTSGSASCACAAAAAPTCRSGSTARCPRALRAAGAGGLDAGELELLLRSGLGVPLSRRTAGARAPRSRRQPLLRPRDRQGAARAGRAARSRARSCPIPANLQELVRRPARNASAGDARGSAGRIRALAAHRAGGRRRARRRAAQPGRRRPSKRACSSGTASASHSRTRCSRPSPISCSPPTSGARCTRASPRSSTTPRSARGISRWRRTSPTRRSRPRSQAAPAGRGARCAGRRGRAAGAGAPADARRRRRRAAAARHRGGRAALRGGRGRACPRAARGGRRGVAARRAPGARARPAGLGVRARGGLPRRSRRLLRRARRARPTTSRLRIEILEGLGWCLHSTRSVPAALEYARSALELAEQLGDPTRAGRGARARRLPRLARRRRRGDGDDRAGAVAGARAALVAGAGRPDWIHAPARRMVGRARRRRATRSSVLHREALDRGDEHSLPFVLFPLARFELLTRRLDGRAAACTRMRRSERAQRAGRRAAFRDRDRGARRRPPRPRRSRAGEDRGGPRSSPSASATIRPSSSCSRRAASSSSRSAMPRRPSARFERVAELGAGDRLPRAGALPLPRRRDRGQDRARPARGGRPRWSRSSSSSAHGSSGRGRSRSPPAAADCCAARWATPRRPPPRSSEALALHDRAGRAVRARAHAARARERSATRAQEAARARVARGGARDLRVARREALGGARRAASWRASAGARRWPG